MDTVRESHSNYTLISDQVRVNSTGLYEITYTGSADANGASATEVEWSLDVGSVIKDGSLCSTYHSDTTNEGNSCTRTLIVQMSAYTYIRLRAVKVGG